MPELLDRTMDALHGGVSVGEALTSLIAGLDERRAGMAKPEWREWIASTVRPHPVRGMLLEDPAIPRRARAAIRGMPSCSTSFTAATTCARA
jgi:hypothetical protein